MNAKVVVITGATRGLGRAMAEEFIRLGHRVLGCGRSAKAIRELDARYGPDHRFSVVDVTENEAVATGPPNVCSLPGRPICC